MTFVAAAIGGAIGYGVGGTLVGAAIGAGVGGMIGGSMNQASAARDAASAQVNAANTATDLQRGMFNTINQQQAPGRAAGYGALNTLQSMLPGTYQQYDAQGNPTTTAEGSGYFTQQYGEYKPFTAQDLYSNLSPSYEFMKNQGLGAVRQNTNVGGGGSNANMAATKFAEDYASTNYQNALNNYMTQQQQGYNQFTNQQGNIYNRLAGVAGIGQASQNASNAAGTNYANAAGQLGVGAATAYGAGQVGSANAMAGIGNNFMQAAMLSKYLA
jgi:hypothetical protein